MITEGLLDLIFGLIKAPFSLLGVFNLNLSEVAVLGDILKFGVWIIGADLFALFIGMIFGYYTLRLSIGAVEWVWNLIK